jgi:hypothetical protein
MADDDKKIPEQRQAELVPDAAGNVRVEVIMGPYRGQHLTMTNADGQAAINAHWARNPTEVLYQHEALSDQERTDAFAAAHAWAQAQWDAAQGTTPPEPPPPEGGETGGETRKRTMRPDEGEGYRTRDVHPEPKHPEPKS